jgi:hypothetical protein
LNFHKVWLLPILNITIRPGESIFLITKKRFIDKVGIVISEVEIYNINVVGEFAGLLGNFDGLAKTNEWAIGFINDEYSLFG